MGRARVRAALALIFAVAAAAWGTAGAAAAPAPARHARIVATPHRRAGGPVAAAVQGSGDLLYHGGRVMTAETSYTIFWEPPTLQSGAATHVSPTYNSLIGRYLADVGGTTLWRIASQQDYQVSGGVTTFPAQTSAVGGSWVDTSPYPASQCGPTGGVDCLTDAQIQAEVRRAVAANKWPTGRGSLFFVFTSYGENSCDTAQPDACFSNTFCAYHSWFTWNTRKVIYANQPYTDTYPQGCGIAKSPNHDPDADSTINVTSHEQLEALTDPTPTATTGGWWDSAGYEIADKCAWTFGKPLYDGGLADQSFNGHYYEVQLEYSNSNHACVRRY